MRIFLDANVLFSAADVRSATRQLLEMASNRGEMVTSPHVAEEARKNIALKRPALLHGLDDILARVKLSRGFAAVEVDPLKDIPVLAGAAGSRCTHLWTGDKRHFGRFYGKTVQGVRIISAVELLELVG